MKTLLRSRIVCVGLALLCIVALDVRIGHALFSTQNKFVKGDVATGSGTVTWFAFPGPLKDGTHFLSYLDHSYLTLQINGELYSNNDNLTPQHSLSTGGVLTKIVDTVRCTWSFGSFDIVQDVYPIAMSNAGQIALKVNVVNRGTSLLAVASQYLLDLEVNGNDGAKVLTKWGYTPRWSQFPVSTNSLPPFYATFENALPPLPPTFTPGYGAAGYTTNTDWGLIPCSRMTIGDWNIFCTLPFSIASVPNTDFVDDAILFEWNTITVGPQSSGTTLKTSYGTGEYEQCFGNFYGLIFYPQHLTWDTTTRTNHPNPFTVDGFVFNNSGTATAASVTTTLTAGDSLTITGPLPVSANGKSQTQSPLTTSIQPEGMAFFEWTVQSSSADTGTTTSRLSLSATATGVQPPYFSSCDLPIMIDASTDDHQQPIYSVVTQGLKKTSGGMIDTAGFSVADNRTNDRGMKQISWVVSSGNVSQFVVSINGANASSPALISNCPTTGQTVEVNYLDTMQSGTIDFTFTDCAGNTSNKSLSFVVTPSQKDTLAPIISNGLIGRTTATFDVSDSRLLDLGLKNIGWAVQSNYPASFEIRINGVVSTASPFNLSGCPKLAQAVQVRQLDSVIAGTVYFQFTDCAGNSSRDSIVFPAHPLADVSTPVAAEPIQGIATPNPCRDEVSIETGMTLSNQSRIRLFDETGAELAPTILASKSPTALRLNTRDLPAGTFVVAIENGAVRRYVRITHIK